MVNKMTDKPYKPTLYDKYDSKRSWLVDTAETPKQQKALPGELKQLRADYLAQKAAQARTQGGITKGTAGAKNVNPLYREQGK